MCIFIWLYVIATKQPPPSFGPPPSIRLPHPTAELYAPDAQSQCLPSPRTPCRRTAACTHLRCRGCNTRTSWSKSWRRPSPPPPPLLLPHPHSSASSSGKYVAEGTRAGNMRFHTRKLPILCRPNFIALPFRIQCRMLNPFLLPPLAPCLISSLTATKAPLSSSSTAPLAALTSDAVAFSCSPASSIAWTASFNSIAGPGPKTSSRCTNMGVPPLSCRPRRTPITCRPSCTMWGLSSSVPSLPKVF